MPADRIKDGSDGYQRNTNTNRWMDAMEATGSQPAGADADWAGSGGAGKRPAHDLISDQIKVREARFWRARASRTNT